MVDLAALLRADGAPSGQFDPEMLDPRDPMRETIPFPSGFGWKIGRERLDPGEDVRAPELRSYTPSQLPGAQGRRTYGERPDAYLEPRLDRAAIASALVGLPMMGAGAALPGTIVESGALSPSLSAILRHPAAESAAGFGGAALGNAAMEGAHEAIHEGLPYALKAADRAMFPPAEAAEKGKAPEAPATPAEGELPHLQWFTPRGELKLGPTSKPEQIKAMQTFLQGIGKYSGAIDGAWKKETAKAAGDYGAFLHDNWKADEDAKAAALRATEAAAKQKGAEATLAAEKETTGRVDAENATKKKAAEDFEAYSKKYAEENPISNFLLKEHPVATTLGVGALSALLSGGSQWGLAKAMYGDVNKEISEAGAALRRGQKFPDTPAGRAGQAAELNGFWRNGQGGGADVEIPFPRYSRKTGFRVNNNVPEADSLYPPLTRMQHAIRQGSAGLASGILEGGVELWQGLERVMQYQDELKAARADLDKGYSDERAKAVLDAEHNLALGQALLRGSSGAAVGAGSMTVHGVLAPPARRTMNPPRSNAAVQRQDLIDRMP